MRTLLLLVLASSLAAAAPRKGPRRPPPPPPPPTAPMPKVQENVNDKVLTALESATKVQAWRVATSGGLRPDPAKAIGSDFTREVPGKDLDAAQLTRLKGILYDEKSYRFAASVAGCDFIPDVSFQVQSGIDTVEALVSFKCSQVLFYIGKPGNRWLPGGTFDVKPARKPLLELAKATMEGDKPSQALK